MQTINFARYFLPLIFIALVAVGLVACTGNNSSTTVGSLALIDPIEVNKTIGTVEWDQNNGIKMASNAYRAISKNSPIRAVFTNKLVPLDLSVDLFTLLDNRNCKISGRINVEAANTECFDGGGTEVDCSDDDALITIDSKLGGALACQDGYISGQYIDGFFNIMKKVDLTETSEFRTSTTLSAINKTSTLDKSDVTQRSDYLFQNDFLIFFFDNEYETYVDLTTCNSDSEFGKVARTGIRSPDVGFLEGDGTDNYYPYTKFTALDLVSTPINVCDDHEDYTYSLSATMANAAMGGGVNRNTQVSWSNMNISLAGKPSGILTLIHKNEDGDYELTLDFNTEGQVTIDLPSSNNGITRLLAEFLELSEP
ncbi:MAG: hypothetical protein ACJAR6_000758 [Oleispira sp.]|jgi:hypothetical protein